MKSNELRIGSWIEYLGKHIQCDINTIHAISQLVGDSAMYKPIVITTEILQKARFKKYTTDELQLEYRDDYWIVFNHNLECLLCYDLNQYVEAIHSHIKHLHQLQNLHFALSGEEITYTP